MSHGVARYQVELLTRQVALRWLENLEYVTVLEMIAEDYQELSEEALEELGTEVHDKIEDLWISL